MAFLRPSPGIDPEAEIRGERVTLRFPAMGDYAAWAEHKRKVNGAKQWIRVGASRVAMFRYPRERDFVVVTFDQDYRSSGLSNVMRKRQYWVKEGAAWKIIYEGSG